MLRAYKKWREIQRDIRYLQSLSDRELFDIGVVRDNIKKVVINGYKNV